MIRISNRSELLKHLPQNAVCAEIGVSVGNFAWEIYHETNPQKLYLIDMWKKKDDFELVHHKFGKNEKIILMKGKSPDILNEFDDGFFDWVYIDADHRYKEVMEDLKICRKKVKTNGIILGHDYVLDTSLVRFPTGVAQAVHEFCKKYNWEISHLTNESHLHHSFAIKSLKFKSLKNHEIQFKKNISAKKKMSKVKKLTENVLK